MHPSIMQMSLRSIRSRLPAPLRTAGLLGAAMTVLVLIAGCGGGEAKPTSSVSSTAVSPDTSDRQEQTRGDEHKGEHGGEKKHDGKKTRGGEHADKKDDGGGKHGGKHDGGHRGVAVGADKAQSLGVRVDTLAAGSATSAISRPATVTFNPDRVARVGPRVEGKVVRVTKDLGDRVQQGEPVAVLSSVTIGKAKSRYLTTKARLKTHRRAYEREKSLRADSISSEAALLEAQAQFEEAKAEFRAAKEALRLYGLSDADVQPAGERELPLSHFRMTSPVTGTLQKRDVQVGQTVGAQETPFYVASSAEMWVMIDGYERDVAAVQEGDRIRLTVSSLPSASFEGTIDFISQTLDKKTRTLRMRAVVDNPDGQLRDGMYGRAHISTDAAVKRALISTDAVQTIDGTSMVFVPGHKAGHFRAVKVRLGQESQGGMVELRSGLQPGDAAVTKGAFNLKSALTAKTRSAAHSH